MCILIYIVLYFILSLKIKIIIIINRIQSDIMKHVDQSGPQLK